MAVWWCAFAAWVPTRSDRRSILCGHWETDPTSAAAAHSNCPWAQLPAEWQGALGAVARTPYNGMLGLGGAAAVGQPSAQCTSKNLD